MSHAPVPRQRSCGCGLALVSRWLEWMRPLLEGRLRMTQITAALAIEEL